MSEVILNTERNRFELEIENQIAFIEFDKIEPNILDFVHTEVPEELSGKGIGSKLAKGALKYSKDNNLKVIPSCPFIKNYIEKHSEWQPLLAKPRA
jgi:predicted GNAT family acetyltransferase